MAEYLKLPEVAQRLDVSEKTARRYVKAGVLPSVFIGGAYRVSAKDLEEFLRRARVEPGKAPAPSLREPTLNDALAEERRDQVVDAQLDYVRRRVEALDLDLQENSPHFRDATAAASWLAMVRTEAKNWTDWVVEHAQLFTSLEGGLYDSSLWRSGFKLAAGLAEYQRLIRIAERRMAAMSDKPSEFMRRRAEQTRHELEASEQRLQELEAANG